MCNLGSLLKSSRDSKNLTLEQVEKATSITNSRLSRMENNTGKFPTPSDLRKLAKLYDLDIVSLFICAGFLEKGDLNNYQKCFRDIEHLTTEEISWIQEGISLLAQKHQNQCTEGSNMNGL